MVSKNRRTQQKVKLKKEARKTIGKKVGLYNPQTEEEFDEAVSKIGDSPYVIDFYSKWVSEAITEDRCGFHLVRVDVAKLKKAAEKFNVTSVPVYAGVDRTRRVMEQKLDGPKSKQEVRQWLNNLCGCQLDLTENPEEALRKASDDLKPKIDERIKQRNSNAKKKEKGKKRVRK